MIWGGLFGGGDSEQKPKAAQLRRAEWSGSVCRHERVL